MAPFSVRRAEASDFVQIQNLVAAAHQANEPWAMSWPSAMVTDELKHADVLVACSSTGKFSGFVLARPPGSDWEITLIATTADFRGNGVAGLLVTALGDHMRAQKCNASDSGILLEVREDNASAIRAYEKCGFQAVGRRAGYYRDGTAAILYKKA